MSDLTHIQVGDTIATHNMRRSFAGTTPQVEHTIYRVTKRTPTQAEAAMLTGSATIRVRVADGKVIGKEYVWAISADDEMLARHEAQIEHRQRHLVAERMLIDLEHALTRRKLTTVQLEALVEAWEQVKAMGPKVAA